MPSEVNTPRGKWPHRIHGVLQEIGAGDHPLLTVYNKADLIEKTADFFIPDPEALLVSAITGENLVQLVDEIVNRVGNTSVMAKW